MKAQFHGIYVSNDLNVLLNCKIHYIVANNDSFSLTSV